jgi:hypothetical protein
MATLVPIIGEGLNRGSRRHEEHSRSDPGGESLSPRVPGGERQHELAPRGASRDGHAEQGAHRKTFFRLIPGFKLMVRLLDPSSDPDGNTAC